VLDSLAQLPSWLVLGTALGLACSLAVAGLFVLTDRLIRADYPSGSDDSEARRRSEIRAYLDRIDERYITDHAVADQRVAFYLPDRAVAITFDARTYFRLVGTETVPVLVEHELPGVALGSRLPFETPTTSADPSDQPAAAAFAQLGVPVDAPLADVRDAYRERVKDVHPDQGGDESSFRELRDAYTTARQHASE